jgi:heptosyltransferase I
MPKVLLVKISSLGDVVHNLPVASDIRAALPDAEIAWVVEEAFAAIPRLHPAVARVIPVAIRRWRSTLWRRETRDEVRRFLDALRDTEYGAVIDSQGLLKSAFIVRAARGRRYGLDWSSAREPLGMFYDRTFIVPWSRHAVERNRSLAAQALGYPVSARADFGIRAERGRYPWLPEQAYAVLLHASSASEKLWPEANWCALARHLKAYGSLCVLPWGSEAERERSERLAAGMPDAIVPPMLPLAEIAPLLAGAHAVIGVDTGLTHLAAALGRPTVGIYCATDPAATGLYGNARAANIGALGRPPAVDDVVSGLDRLGT